MEQDNIRIKNLELFANHGVYGEETVLGQKFLVNMTAWLDLEKAGASDDLDETVNYGTLCHFMGDYFSGHTFRLIEAAAHQMAEEILFHFPGIERIRLEVKKPWAPVRMPLETVSVEIERGWHTVYLSVGSNMGDRREHLERGMNRLKENPRIRDLVVSGLIETEPYGYTDQDSFLNGAVRMRTLYSPAALLDFLHQIEAEEGRVRDLRWGPRVLDLDIVFYDDLVMETEDLIIPHIDMENRWFVLKPLAELCPGKVHPVYGRRVKDLLRDLEESGNRKSAACSVT